MVLSVVAMSASFAGAAAAQQVDQADRTVADAELAPGETTTVTVDVTLAESSSLSIFEGIDPAIGGDNITVVDDGGAIIAGPNDAGDNVTFNLQSVQDVTVEYNVTVPETAEDGDTITISSASGSDVEVGSDTISVVEDGGADPDPDPEPEPEPGDRPDADVYYDAQDGDLDDLDVWSGQTVAVETFNDPVYIREGIASDASDDDAIVDDIRAEDGWIVFDSSDLDERAHYIENTGDDSVYGTFWVDSQDFDIEFDPATAFQGESATLVVDTNRDEMFNATVDVEGVDNEDAVDLFENATYLEDDDLVHVEDLTAGTHTVDFGAVDADLGNYTVEMEVADTGVSDSSTVEVVSPTQEDADFLGDNGIFEEHRGDQAVISLDVTGTDQAVVTVGDEANANYVAELNITGIDTSESVDIRMNTFEAGHADADEVYELVGDNSDATLDAERTHGNFSNDDSRLAGGTYRLSVAVNDRDRDRGTLVLNERSTGEATTHVVRGDVDVNDRETLLDAVGEDTQREDGEVAIGDYVVAEIDVSGVFGYDNDAEGISNEATHQNPGRNEDPNNFGPTEVYEVPDEDTVYAVYDTSGQEDGDEYLATFKVGQGNPYIPDSDSVETATAPFTVSEESVSIDELDVEGTDGQTITGTSNLAYGSQFYVEVDSLDDNNPFRKTGLATVAGDGTWSAEIDFTGDAGTPIEVTLPEYDESVEGTVETAEDAAFETDVQSPEALQPGDDFVATVSVDNVGGAAGNISAALTFAGDEADSNTVELEPEGADEFDLTASTKGLEPGDYDWSVEVGEDVYEGTITIEDDSSDDGGSDDGGSDDGGSDDGSSDDGSSDDGSSDDGSSDDGSSDDGSSDDDGDDGDGSDDQPGFGVAVALVALLAAAMLALRRQN